MSVVLDCWLMNVGEMRRFVTLVDIYQSTRSSTREDLNLQQHQCGHLRNPLKTRKFKFLRMQRANQSGIRIEIDTEVVWYSETLVRRTEIHVVIFLKTILFRAVWIMNMIATIESQILYTDKNCMYWNIRKHFFCCFCEHRKCFVTFCKTNVLLHIAVGV